MSSLERRYSFKDLPEGSGAYSPSTSISIDAAGSASKIDLREWSGGSVKPGTDHTGASNIYIYGVLSEDGSGTPEQIHDEDGVPLELKKIDGSPVALPSACFQYPWIWLISSISDSGAKLYKVA